MLRPFTTEDAPRVQALAGAAEVAATTLNLPHPYPDGAAAMWIGRHALAAADGQSYTWAIVHAADAALLGAVALTIEPRHARGGLGYWLGAPYWGQGYTTEAARRITVFGFVDLGLQRIEAHCFPRNRASARVMEKVGLRYEGLLRGYVRKGEVFEDVLMYGLVRTDIEGLS